MTVKVLIVKGSEPICFRRSLTPTSLPSNLLSLDRVHHSPSMKPIPLGSSARRTPSGPSVGFSRVGALYFSPQSADCGVNSSRSTRTLTPYFRPPVSLSLLPPLSLGRDPSRDLIPTTVSYRDLSFGDTNQGGPVPAKKTSFRLLPLSLENNFTPLEGCTSS